MKFNIETVQEHRERMLREDSVYRVPGRALPTNCQWTGQDQPGGKAAARRLRQQAALEAKRKPAAVETADPEDENP